MKKTKCSKLIYNDFDFDLENNIESFLYKLPAKEYDEASMILEDMSDHFNSQLIAGNYSTGSYHFDLYKNILSNLLTSDNEEELILESILTFLPSYFFTKRNNNIILKKHYINKEWANTEAICYYIIKFINYLSKESKFGKIFTMQDLYDSFCEQEHKLEMDQLKQFIITTNEYYNKIKDGNNAQDLIDTVNNTFSNKLPVETEKDAIICAHAKTNIPTNNPIVLSRIKELKQRNS